MTKTDVNWPAVVVIAICATVWAAAAGSSYKLGKVYEHRGPQGFRHALMERVEHRVGQLVSPILGNGAEG
ncbi:MAG: hypothetical protein JWP35_1387 [Caulobacter sp.]|nr:hypothetical protein [Caulobacter sp.]